MTKLAAIQGLLNGTYQAIRGANFGPKEYVYIKNNSFMKHSSGYESDYTDMQNLGDVSWYEHTISWYTNIPSTGLLVIAGSSIRRAMSYSAPNIILDDSSSVAVSSCTPLILEEIQQLYRNLQSI